ncbi:MAG: putative DNA binding domain-containing protein [Nitrospirae bacterium]|nr:putative DNA binding domain-containing protein [Nitrospirota bacterium]
MVDAAQIQQRLSLGEDSRTEFKGVAKAGFDVDLDIMAKAIVAFANSGGGVILIGVEDDGSLSGIGDMGQADSIMRKVSQACRDKVHPPISCTQNKIMVGEMPLLVVEIPGFSTDRPFRAGHLYYVRDANRSREASRDELVRLLQSADSHFDETPVSGSTYEDLDQQATSEFTQEMYGRNFTEEELPRYLQELKCLDPSGIPTLAGILFFAKFPGKWLLDARISAVRIRGKEFRHDVKDQQDITGRISQQLESVLAFIRKQIVSPSHIEGWDRVEQPGPGGIPEEALREAVLNALAHRDYRASSQIRLFVFDDRIEIVNPGGLLNKLTIENIKNGITQRRNPIISALLNRTTKRESIGFGVPEMIRRMRQLGAPDPDFREEGGHFRVVLSGRVVRP